MTTAEIIAGIDDELARLHQVRYLLGGHGPTATRAPKTALRKKRVLSPEARERIATAQRKRWAKQKRSAKKAA